MRWWGHVDREAGEACPHYGRHFCHYLDHEITSLDHGLATHERRAYLATGWLFFCACDRCVGARAEPSCPQCGEGAAPMRALLCEEEEAIAIVVFSSSASPLRMQMAGT